MAGEITAGRDVRQRLSDAVGAQLVLQQRFRGQPPRIDERYEIEAILARFGFGLLCRARNLEMQRTVALVLFAFGDDDDGVRSALRDARALVGLENPAIVAVHAADEGELIAAEQRLRCAFIEMELVSELPRHLRDRRTAADVIAALLGRPSGDATTRGAAHGSAGSASVRRTAILIAAAGGIAGAAWFARRERVDSPAPASFVAAPTEPAPRTEQRKPPSTAKPAPAAEPSCIELAPFAGRWQIAMQIVWTEHATAVPQIHPYEIELTPERDCSFAVVMQRSPEPGDAIDPAVAMSTTGRARVTRRADGTWIATTRVQYDNDRRTYEQPEHDEMILELSKDDALRGAYRRVDDRGMRLRSGLLLATRNTLADATRIAQTEPTCFARCWIECAGASAEATCNAASCRPRTEGGGDLCGPAGPDFVPPPGARVTRNTLREGRSLIDGDATSTTACTRNAAALAGRWGIWRGTGASATRFELSVRTGDGCRIDGELRKPDGTAIAVIGEVTPFGSWSVVPRQPDADFGLGWVLVGTAVAFGLDAGDGAQPLRAWVEPG